MHLSWIRNAQIRFPVLMTLLLFIGMMPNPGVTKIKCYDCNGDKHCEEGQGAKLQKKTTTCTSVCYTEKITSSSGTIDRTTRGCHEGITATQLKCINNTFGSWCYDDKDSIKIQDLWLCEIQVTESQFGRQEKGQIRQQCYCDSELCNHEKEIVKAEAGAEHSSPNKKLVISAISMMATVYLSVSQLN